MQSQGPKIANLWKTEGCCLYSPTYKLAWWLCIHINSRHFYERKQYAKTVIWQLFLTSQKNQLKLI